MNMSVKMKFENCTRKKFVRLNLNRPQVEDIMVNAKEHKLLKKFSKELESRHDVLIRMPMTKISGSDVVFVSIEGEPSNRKEVKNFLSEKMKPIETRDDDNILQVTLSDDSDSESSLESEEEDVINLDDEDASSSEIPSLETLNESVVVIETPTCSRNELASEETSNESASKETPDDSICVIESTTCSSDAQTVTGNQQSRKRKNNKKVRSKSVSASKDGTSVASEDDSANNVSKKARLSESVLIIEESQGPSSSPVLDFIPLDCGSKSNKHNRKTIKHNNINTQKNSDEINNDIVIEIDEPKIPRRLRPIVIDGSNVAMEHGKKSRTFSIKGIKIAIDFFLKRGHEKVNAFIPKYRQNLNPNRLIPTTDGDLLKELERQQLVVLTPSRRVNGKCIASYDDRFIIELAVSNGGVIVSNDNFRDLMDESEEFKQAIEQRLLMFCFADDQFMIPQDPLGRHGPRLDDFLSFPNT